MFTGEFVRVIGSEYDMLGIIVGVLPGRGLGCQACWRARKEESGGWETWGGVW